MLATLLSLLCALKILSGNNTIFIINEYVTQTQDFI
jgi:hypothetical protein